MPEQTYPKPVTRRLRVYAFDPQSSTRIASVGFNIATIELPWEPWFEADLKPGPVNEYLEIIDVDPVSGQFYEPVNLNHPAVLARDGLDPSEGDPRFHQQMVFAVAMKTIRSFERALGRRVFWSPKWDERRMQYTPVRRLRVYPHGLREANAYYSRDKKALLFGYFPSTTHEASANWVFTALSHDIIAHETTHAILDGLHRRYAEATSVDSLAFHEAFADIVALLSHFTLGEALKAHIQMEGGNLEERGLMSGLAEQFGNARGNNGPLREAIDNRLGEKNVDTTLLASATKPHERGAILVAAIFDAFLTIYKQRTADLLRIAGISINRADRRELHPDLAARLAREASKSADHLLRMCIRALDYLPPVDVRFGEFLRAIITADTDLIPNDTYRYRIAVIEAFRRRGILPEGTLSLAPDSLCWETPETNLGLDGTFPQLNLGWVADRSEAEAIAEDNRKQVHSWLMAPDDDNDLPWQRACGVVFREDLIPKSWKSRLQSVLAWPGTTRRSKQRPGARIEVHSVRTTRRTGPDGQELYQLIVEVTQRRRGFLSPDRQEAAENATGVPDREDFLFRGGSTLIFDLKSGELRYAIRKSITNEARLSEQRSFLEANPSFRIRSHYSDDAVGAVGMDEPFAFAHRGY